MNNLPLLVRSGTFKSKPEETWAVTLTERDKKEGCAWWQGWGWQLQELAGSITATTELCLSGQGSFGCSKADLLTKCA